MIVSYKSPPSVRHHIDRTVKECINKDKASTQVKEKELHGGQKQPSIASSFSRSFLESALFAVSP